MAVSDIQLINQIKTGEYRAFEELFERYFGVLCNYASKFFSDGFISEDVVQEVFIKIWEGRKRINVTGSVKSYLYSAVKNRCLNKIKSESARLKHSELSVGEWETSISQDELEQEEFRNHLFWCIGKLPPRCREVFMESRFEEMKQEQIANHLDISIKTVKAQIGKALKLIRDCLKITYPEYF